MTTVDNAVRVATNQGPIVGRRVEYLNEFLGIPFAAAPVGTRRWQPAAPAATWSNDLYAVDPGPAPLQVPPPPQLPPIGPTAEDCLRLSVWAPAHQPGPLPVLVWIYGGGFETGSAATEFTNPRLVAREERCIIVAANYRVGALGFAHLTHRGGPFASAANLGLTDVIAALTWVRDNIAAFGGNSAAVTVMGQSAGGFLAGALLGAPSAKGLFHQLVCMSGGTSRILPAAAAEHMGDQFLIALAQRIGTADLHELAAAPAEAVLAAQQTVPARDIGVRNGRIPQAFGVVHDGTVVTNHPQQVVEAGQAATVGILTGATEREVAAFRMATAEPFAPDGAAGMVDETTSWGANAERAERIVTDYLRRTGSPDAAREALLTDWIYRLPAARLAHAHAIAGGRAWAYTVEGGGALGPAGHTADLPLLFGTADIEPIRTLMRYPSAGQALRTAAGSAFRDALGRFIRTGDPGFEPWSSTHHPTLVIGDTTAIDPDHYAHVLRLWEGIPRP